MIIGINNRKPKKYSRKTILLMILILVIVAGIGVMISFENNDISSDNVTHIENAIVEMTTHLDGSENVAYEESDAIDYNENQSSMILDTDKNQYYSDDDLEH